MTHQWNLITTPRVDGCGMAGLGVAVLGEWCGVEGWVEGWGAGGGEGGRWEGGAGAECRRGGVRVGPRG